jgi:hypothetical protein
MIKMYMKTNCSKIEDIFTPYTFDCSQLLLKELKKESSARPDICIAITCAYIREVIAIELPDYRDLQTSILPLIISGVI